MNNRTAIIVSGALRHLKEASNSWKINGDYYLIVDKDSYEPQTLQISPDKLDILSEINQCPIKFKNVTILDDLCSNTNSPWAGLLDTRLEMSKKWQIGYNVILSQDIKYDRILLLRPDVHITSSNWDLLNTLEVNDNTICTTQAFYTHEGLERVGDIFLLCNFAAFATLAKFHNFLLTKHPVQLKYNEDTHSLLAYHLRNNGIDVIGNLSLFNTVILRKNSKHMFANGLLKNEYTFSDLATKAAEWWDANI